MTAKACLAGMGSRNQKRYRERLHAKHPKPPTSPQPRFQPFDSFQPRSRGPGPDLLRDKEWPGGYPYPTPGTEAFLVIFIHSLSPSLRFTCPRVFFVRHAIESHLTARADMSIITWVNGQRYESAHSFDKGRYLYSISLPLSASRR